MNVVQFVAHYLSPLVGVAVLAMAIDHLIHAAALPNTPQNATHVAATYPAAVAASAILGAVGWVLTDANPAAAALMLASAAAHAVRAGIARNVKKSIRDDHGHAKMGT